MTVLEEAKILLDIKESDVELIKKLNIIIGNAGKQVLSYLTSGTTEVPKELEYIVCELAVARFNRIGNEGMTSFSQEGESITYSNGNDISPYLPAIQAWNQQQNDNTRGVVRFV